MIVDFAVHLHPESVLPPPFSGTEMGELVGHLLTSPDELLDRYEESDYDAAVVSQPFYMGRGDADLVARANDAMLEWIRGEDQLYGLAAIPVSAGPHAAAAEFERCIENGYHGGGVETETAGIELTHDDLESVLSVAERTGAPLMVHPKLHESLHPDVLDDTYKLNATFGREAALCESIVKVIHDGVLDRHPDLKLVYHHLGGNVASMLGRVHLNLQAGYWPGQEAVKPFPEFRPELEKLYVDTSGYIGYPGPIKAALETFPSAQVLLGTDYPFEARDVEEIDRFLTVIRDVTSQYDFGKITGGNALDILVNLD